MANQTMSGPAELSFRDALIPADVLSEVAVELTEGTRDRDTLAGTFTKPSGTQDTGTVTVTLFPPSWSWLGENLLRSRYNAPTGGSQLTGNVIWNANTCAGSYDVGPLNVHFTCETTDDNDLYLYNAMLQVNVNPTYNNSDEISVELTFHANPDENGNVYRIGTGDLTAPSYYDTDAQATLLVTSS